MTGIITAKTDYIIKTKNALINLKEFENDFRYEAIIINHIKCKLMQKEDIDGFYAQSVYVGVHESHDGYFAYYLDKTIEIMVFDKQIIDYTVNTN